MVLLVKTVAEIETLREEQLGVLQIPQSFQRLPHLLLLLLPSNPKDFRDGLIFTKNLVFCLQSSPGFDSRTRSGFDSQFSSGFDAHFGSESAFQFKSEQTAELGFTPILGPGCIPRDGFGSELIPQAGSRSIPQAGSVCIPHFRSGPIPTSEPNVADHFLFYRTLPRYNRD